MHLFTLVETKHFFYKHLQAFIYLSGNSQRVFQNGCGNFHFHRKNMSVLISLYSCQNFILPINKHVIGCFVVICNCSLNFHLFVEELMLKMVYVNIDHFDSLHFKKIFVGALYTVWKSVISIPVTSEKGNSISTLIMIKLRTWEVK